MLGVHHRGTETLRKTESENRRCKISTTPLRGALWARFGMQAPFPNRDRQGAVLLWAEITEA